jgi:DNA-binding MarR family transcriptional regulator
MCMYRTFDLSETRDCHCLAARRMARELTRLYEEKLRPHGLRATQFSVMATLSQSGPSTINEIADMLGLERTTLSRSATLLERNGWVSSDLSALDARERLLSLTPDGLLKLEEAFPAWKEAQEQVEQTWIHQLRPE